MITREATDLPRPLSPSTALDLRIRFLEAILLPRSTSADLGQSTPKPRVPIARHVATLREQLRTALEVQGGSEAVKRFVANYDANAPLLTVGALPAAPESDRLSPETKATLVLEAENEIRTLERDLRELQVLNERNVVDAGQLEEANRLQPGLVDVRAGSKPLISGYSDLETRTTALLQRYNHYISTLSELFVSWDNVLTDAEAALTRIEKSRDQTFDIS
ncbi:hypothetical protein BMF94_6397 [Rhodotorula taiwanensis]|uniref:Uncharacterized protein n=1 Tax=Rhodotorula taiwanensis TaxID=741276 RepID=A0A2S5B1F7_9BASI|nr:hypothetical protein BMF94_6397 [Rhodotorula taiwanensis]